MAVAFARGVAQVGRHGRGDDGEVRQVRRPHGTVRTMSLIAATGEFNGLAVAIFAVVLAFTLLITRWAARRTHSTSEFYAAGRGITAKQNGLAIAGDYLSASTFLGYAGLMYLFGFDGWLLGLAALMSFIPVLYLLAERMRNSGKYTLADVLSLPPQAAPGACRGGDHVAAGDRHLPDRPARRRRRADPGAGRHQLHARGRHLRRVHDDLRRVRRHARHHVGADRQGRDADDGGRDRERRRAGEVQLQPEHAARQRGLEVGEPARASSARASTSTGRCSSSPPASRSSSAPPGCRTS